MLVSMLLAVLLASLLLVFHFCIYRTYSCFCFACAGSLLKKFFLFSPFIFHITHVSLARLRSSSPISREHEARAQVPTFGNTQIYANGSCVNYWYLVNMRLFLGSFWSKRGILSVNGKKVRTIP